MTVHGFHYTIAEVGSTIWTGGAGKIQIWEFDVRSFSSFPPSAHSKRNRDRRSIA